MTRLTVTALRHVVIDPRLLQRVQRVVAEIESFDRRYGMIRGRDRQPGIRWPRQVSMYLARELTEMSLAQVGEFFDRDHSTVRHACQKVTDTIAADAEAAARVRDLHAQLA